MTADIPTGARFRKKPIVIEAVQYGRRFYWPDWFADAVSANKIVTYGTGKFNNHEEACFADIKTLEGTMTAQEGDWIIHGIKGEIYPCKPDIFAATYVPVESTPTGPVAGVGALREAVQMAAERLSLEGQLLGYSDRESALRGKMGSIAKDLFVALRAALSADGEGS